MVSWLGMVASVSLAYMPHTVGLGAGAAMFLGAAIILVVLQVQYWWQSRHLKP